MENDIIPRPLVLPEVCVCGGFVVSTVSTKRDCGASIDGSRFRSSSVDVRPDRVRISPSGSFCYILDNNAPIVSIYEKS
eukprot:scaffold1663_cov171-Amphora_coffeaeformis.AAC.22